VLVAALGACSAIPTSGPVVEGDVDVPEPESVVVLAEGPIDDAEPTTIVSGFLFAGSAGLTGDFGVAREFLAGDAVGTWDPLGGVVVASSYQVERTGDTEVTVDVAVTAKVDTDGRYTEAPPDARESIVFEMVQDSRGQWRIAQAPDGLIVTPATFAARFAAAPLYFWTTDQTMLVPELRFYPSRNVATSAVKGLLAGPSDWLADSVSTAVPDGVQLKPESVVVTSGTAEVDLEPAAAVQGADREHLVTQLETTLLGLRGITQVVVRAGADGPRLEGGAEVAPSVTAQAEVVVDDAVAALAEGGLAPVEALGSLAGLDARGLARDDAGTIRVALSGPDRLVTVPTADDDATTLLTAPALAAPSVDRFDGVWTASGGHVMVAQPDGTTLDLAPGWLTGRTVTALRVAHDGARIAVVSTGTDGTTIDLAGVVRDEAGAPQRLSEPIRAGASVTTAEAVVWADDLTVAMLGRSAGSASMRLVPVGGQSTALPDVADAVALAAGRGVRTLLVATEEGELLRYDGQTWGTVPGVSGVRDPSYPG
jgi:hypothetical protein